MATQSPGLAAERKLNENLHTYAPDNDQKEAYAFYLQRFEKARKQRHAKREEFDGLDLETDYVLNKRAANAYLPPKKNDDEVRIVTGTTEKKIEVVLNELVGMNLQPEAQVFDHNDNELRNLGQDFIDIVSRTNQIERDDDFWKAFARELITQRAVFIEEIDDYVTYYNRGKSFPGRKGLIKKENVKPVTFHRARKRLLTNLQVFLGDMNIPARRFQEQPYILKYVRRTYDEAKVCYGDWDNWKHVVKGGSLAHSPFGYRMYKIDGEEVEEIHYLDPSNDEYQIMINGVLMFDEPAPLFYEVTEDRRYPMTMTVLKEMGEDCAYGKPLTASAKTLQGLNSEVIRLLIRKFRQAIEPPMTAKTQKVYSKDIWMAGAVTYGVSATDFEVLNKTNQGITNSEFSIYDLIERKTEEFIGASPANQGMSDGKNQTATEIINQQRQFIKQLGLSVLAMMTAKRDATYLRIYNLLENFIDPINREYDKTTDTLIDIFDKFTVMDGQLGDGKRGKKIVQFTDKPLGQQEMEQVYQYEQSEEMAGRPVRVRFVNVKMLSSIPTFWYVTVAPRERDGSALSKVMFNDKLKQAVDISAVTKRPINDDKIIDEYEYTWQIKDMFKKSAPAGQAANPEAQAQGENLMAQIKALEGSGQSQMGDQMQEGEMAGQMNKPSLNTAAGNVA
jgi:hypothetical protein